LKIVKTKNFPTFAELGNVKNQKKEKKEKYFDEKVWRVQKGI